MSFHPYPNVYKFFNQFAAPDSTSPETSSRSQGLRKSGPRSKTGCTTCKQRRVKCDETKPGCIRCQNLGRECGGYAPEAPDETTKQAPPVPIHPRPMTVIPQNPSGAAVGDEQERMYFQRFCEKTAGEICGSFDPTFWTVKVLQLCHRDPPIRHGIIALGALSKSLEVTSTPNRLSLSGFPQFDHRHLDEHHRFALRQYSLAIASLRKILSDGRRHLRTSLTSCVLFMCLEALQGNYDQVVTHARGGSRLLGDWRTARRGLSSRLSQDSLSEIQDGLIDDLGRMFARLDVQALFAPPPCPGSYTTSRDDPQPTPSLYTEELVVPDTFDSTTEAREMWDFLMAGIVQFHRRSIYYRNRNPVELVSQWWIQQHDHYSTQLIRWRSAFQAVYAAEGHTSTTMPDETVMLSLYYNLASILLSTSCTHTEMVYEDFKPLFQEIVTKSNHLLTSSDNPATTSRFTLDLGTIIPLAFTAVKCRDRRIRRQAISLLWSKARREGLCFDTITIARVLAWILSIESEGIPPDYDTIPETSRVLVNNVHFNPEERWLWVQLSCVGHNERFINGTRETTFSW
ncbi:hypothetical protein B7463_g11236, partial [Scytalidium lignicola]